MKFQLRPLGQRLALVLPDAMLDQLGIDEDSTIELTLTEDGGGVVIRPVPAEAPSKSDTERYSRVRTRLSPRSSKLLAFLEARQGDFFAPGELGGQRKLVNSSAADVFIAIGRVAFHDARVVVLEGRIGCLTEGERPADVKATWGFSPVRVKRSQTAASKDAIVLRILEEHRGTMLAREEVYAQLHRQWRGEGGVMLRDVDTSSARLAFSHGGICIRDLRVGLDPD